MVAVIFALLLTSFGQAMPRGVMTGLGQDFPSTSLGVPYEYELIRALEQTEAYRLVALVVSRGDAKSSLVLLMDFLDIPVYQAQNGECLTNASISSLEYPYLYDFQIELLAYALQKKVSTGLLVASLQELFPLANSLEWEWMVGDILQASDTAWFRTVERTLEGSYGIEDRLPQVIWSFLLFDPLDLSHLNPVVQLLLLFELLSESSEERPARSSLFSSVARAGSSSNLCDLLEEMGKEINSKPWSPVWGELSQKLEDKYPQLKKANRAKDALDIVYRMIMQLGYEISLTISPAEVHYRHATSEENQMTFTAYAEFVLDFGSTVVSCGRLSGYEFPPYGPVANMVIEWDFSSNLVQHGSLKGVEPSLFGGYWNKTNEEGEAIAYFQPRLETPRGNFLLVDTGTVWANLQGVQKDLTGFLGERLFPIGEVGRWWVSWHVPRRLEPKRPTPFQQLLQRPRVLPVFPNR